MNWIENAKEIDTRVLARVDISQEGLFWLRVNTGLDFLNLNYDSDTAQAYRDTRIFWAWWLQVWTGKDTEMLERLDKCSPGFMMHMEDYKRVHDPEFIHYRPTRVVTKAMLPHLMSIIRDKEKEVQHG